MFLVRLFKFIALFFIMTFGYLLVSISIYAKKEQYRQQAKEVKDTTIIHKRKHFLLRDRLLNSEE